jgi:hypothetical protein
MKFKDGAEIITSEFWYDVFDGGYIKPDDLLEDEELADEVNEAILLLRKFQLEAEKQGVLEEM